MFEELKEFGLSENEIEVYITLIKTGVSTANRVARITGLKRSTTYDTLATLGIKGIVSTVVKDNVNHFQAADPQKILQLVEEKKEKIASIVPEIQALHKTVEEKTGVTYFEGKKGVLTVLNDVLDQGKELWFYGSRKMGLVALKNYPENFILKRVSKGIYLKAVLAGEDKGDPAYTDKKIYKLSNLKFLKSLDGVETNVFIYSDRVAFLTSGENLVGVIIKNKDVVAQQKKIFKLLWKQAKK